MPYSHHLIVLNFRQTSLVTTCFTHLGGFLATIQSRSCKTTCIGQIGLPLKCAATNFKLKQIILYTIIRILIIVFKALMMKTRQHKNVKWKILGCKNSPIYNISLFKRTHFQSSAIVLFVECIVLLRFVQWCSWKATPTHSGGVSIHYHGHIVRYERVEKILLSEPSTCSRNASTRCVLLLSLLSLMLCLSVCLSALFVCPPVYAV